MSTDDITVTPAGHIGRVTNIQTSTNDCWRASIVLRGDLDAANVPELRAELEHHLDAGRRVIRLDAAGVTFIDSTVIGELITVSERCRREHGALILTRVPPRVRRILSIAGLDGVLLIDGAGDVRTGGPA
jgi:anti-sigma B factor antagonist